MSAENPQPTPVTPVTALHDPRAITILSTEHWSLLSARSLAYNEAFVRGGMFLTFLSMSFVALALLAQAMSFASQFLTVAAIVLSFDFIIGLTTYARISGANVDDLRAMHGMARIRHAYSEIAPIVAPYFTTPINDDIDSVVTGYGISPRQGTFGTFVYGITTSGGMIGLITAMVGGVLAGVLALLLGTSGEVAVWLGLAGGAIAFIAIVGLTLGSVTSHQASITALFPANPDE
jgi:hypothetical protein